VVIVPSRKSFVKDFKLSALLIEVASFPAKTMGLLPDHRCAYSVSLAICAQPRLRTRVSNPNSLVQMTAII
jgi:hypothetical protein